jgi:predicted RNA-binding protein with RPS1 domain
MEEIKAVRLEKFISIEESEYEVSIVITKNINDKWHIQEDVNVIINRFNERKLSYSYKTTKSKSEENRYIEAVQEGIQKFQDDKSIQKLLEWDGKLKYKISL